MTKKDRVLQILREYGPLTCLEIANIMGSKYRLDIHKAKEAQQTIYSSLVPQGLIEKVPDTKPVKWRIKE